MRKDLLPLTARRVRAAAAAGISAPGDAGAAATTPSDGHAWWLDCFDLATEFHHFSAALEASRATG